MDYDKSDIAATYDEARALAPEALRQWLDLVSAHVDRSAISLIVSLLGVAGLYLLRKAEFLFAVQIVLYIGGIMVLFLFVIMLVNLDQAAKERQ